MTRIVKGAALFSARLVVVVVVLGVVFVASLVSGCGGAPDAARTAVSVTASGLAAADSASRPIYELRSASCYDIHDTAEGYRECVSRVDGLEAGLRTTHRALLSTQAGLDAWDAGDEGAGFLATAPCLAESLAQLLAALVAAGVEVPEAIQSGAGLLGAFGGECK